MHYRNTISVFNDKVLFTSSGIHWDRHDALDGLHCLELNTGRHLWHVRSHNDANQALIDGTSVYFGDDDGYVYAVDARSGETEFSERLSAKVCTRPVAIHLDGTKYVIFLPCDGQAVIFDPATRRIANTFEVPGYCTVTPVVDPTGDRGNVLIVANQNGNIFRVAVSLEGAALEPLVQNISSQRPEHTHSRYRELSNLQTAGSELFASYAVSGSENMPLSCYDLVERELKWTSRSKSTERYPIETVGSCRVDPIITGHLVLATFSYSAYLYAFSRETGLEEWRIKLDSGMSQNWSSPKLFESYALVPRVNGVIHKIDIERPKLVGSISVVVPGMIHDGDEVYGDRGLERVGPGPERGLKGGIASTPEVTRDLTIVGTVSGDLFAFDNRRW
ncbi:MAG: PQQ-binding-like beta-propeller repeat protein [Hyphomicrobiaceae bacterium]|nr:PQQ-binding-like beta-propeller repeat protein [Hyphomicrobiaceae bacterium]